MANYRRFFQRIWSVLGKSQASRKKEKSPVSSNIYGKLPSNHTSLMSLIQYHSSNDLGFGHPTPKEWRPDPNIKSGPPFKTVAELLNAAEGWLTLPGGVVIRKPRRIRMLKKEIL